MSSAILSAIDQAVGDGVDVINYSIGTDAFTPWQAGDIPMAFLNARNAGIFVVTSAGNEGPDAGSIGSPANAPWIVAVGNATHNRVFGNFIQDFNGGNTSPPPDLFGGGINGSGVGVRKIVHAGDYGSALCGTGASSPFTACGSSTSPSNPWSGQHPFNGEIVVCDRGEYGRVEKGLNVKLAGAGGYILANTDEQGESIEADDHCIPGIHIGDEDGDLLRAWLSGGSNHMASIASGIIRGLDDLYGDRMYFDSSRGPVLPPVQDVLKPDVIAPGTSILSASDVGSQIVPLSGTSMSSPHVAGAAALMVGVHPDWNVSQIVSALATTSTAELARDDDGSPATPHERGAGRPQLGEAANAGLYLNVTGLQFALADPSKGGNPKELNLPGLVDSACYKTCEFDRTVTDQMGGGNWHAQAQDFPAGVTVKITPANFTLANGGSKTLKIEIDLESSGIVDDWVYGKILLTAAGSSDQALTVAAYSPSCPSPGLPSSWTITDSRDTGWKDFDLCNLAALPEATFTSGGLVKPDRTTQTLAEDPTNADPFDGGDGVYTVWHDLPKGGMWLHAETLTSTAVDLDLYVGRDDNENGVADLDELLCYSATEVDIENCDLFDLPPGSYWILVQNWDGGAPGDDDATLLSAAIVAAKDSTLVASGPGITTAKEDFEIRASWSDINALNGEQWLGAVGIGSMRSRPYDVGIVPVRFNRNGYDTTQTVPLMNGVSHRFSLGGNTEHKRIFIDIPPGVTDLTISAEGTESGQNNALKLELFRQLFANAVKKPPFASLPNGLPSAGTASGSGGNGPTINLTGSVTQGRYFVKVSNTSAQAASISMTANVTSSPSNLNPHRGLWDFDRNISQGAEWNGAGEVMFLVWYAYDDNGQPTWYIASGPAVTGNIWTADLLRVTNDGAEQQENVVGKIVVTFIADNEMIYGYSLLGQSGFDPMHPNGPNTCPGADTVQSFTGHWYRGVPGLGGSTVLSYANAKSQVHYIFDAQGGPRWIFAARDGDPGLTDSELHLLQFKGFCAVCTPAAISYQRVGDVTFVFAGETSGDWTLNFELKSPLVQSIDRADSVVKLSDTLVCE